MRSHSLCAAVWLAIVLAAGWAGADPLPLSVVARQAGSFASASGGDRPGFEVELLRRFASWHQLRRKREVSLGFRFVSSVDAVLTGVREGVDCGIGGLTATPERDRFVDFSVGILPVRSIVVAPAGRFDAETWRAQMRDKRLGACHGTTNADDATRVIAAIPGARVDLSLPCTEEIFSALVGNPPRVDALVVDLPQYWSLAGAGFAIVANAGPPQEIAIVFPQGSPLKAEFDTFFAEYGHSNSYYGLVTRYFGEDAARMVRLSRGQPD